jgi:hypothetical protein
MKLIKGQANTVVVTLTENTTLNPVRYLLQLKNKNKLTLHYCLVTEISINLDRNNEFVVSETDTPTPANGQISLSAGDYIYTFYQMTPAQAAAINFNAIDTSIYTAVETMNCKVYKQPAVINTSYEHTEINTTYER